MVRFISLSAFLLSFAAQAAAKDFGVRGETFEIAEPHLIESFENKLSELEESGRIDEIHDEMVNTTKERVYSPEPVTGLTKVVKNDHFYWDPTVTAEQDYLGPEGEVIVKKGTTKNALDFVSMSQPMIFIDGADEAQVEYALSIHGQAELGAKIVLTNGRPFDLMREHKVRMFFDQKSILTTKLGITRVPSKVIQEGRMLRIDEVALK